MTLMDSRMPTLSGALWPAGGLGLARGVLLAIAGSALLALSAKVQVPFWPVPMTMQTFVVLVLGATYGARLAGATVALYLAEGALGLPVFATGSGLAYMAGPTGGYLLGFLAAALIAGFLAERGFDRRWPTALAAFLIADAALLALGVGWLSALIGWEKALTAGLLPFLPAEALKIALATAVLPLCWTLCNGRR